MEDTDSVHPDQCCLFRLGDTYNVPTDLESFSRPLESFSRLLESFSRPLESFRRPLESFSHPLKSFRRPLFFTFDLHICVNKIQGHAHVQDLTRALKLLEDSETSTMDKIANIEACMDAMAEEELAAWVNEAATYVQEISHTVDAARETKRVKMGWLNGVSSSKEEEV